jgi:hypothetical protein
MIPLDRRGEGDPASNHPIPKMEHMHLVPARNIQ